MNSVNFNRVIQEARDLDAAGNPEYLRGMCELIARCFPTMHMFTDERADQIKAMIAEVPDELA